MNNNNLNIRRKSNKFKARKAKRLKDSNSSSKENTFRPKSLNRRKIECESKLKDTGKCRNKCKIEYFRKSSLKKFTKKKLYAEIKPEHCLIQDLDVMGK